MPHIIPLNTDRDTVKRLILDDHGRATLQTFTKTGRVEIHLTADELEVVRTSGRVPSCDCTGREARALNALAEAGWRREDVYRLSVDAETLEDRPYGAE
jgi:hypothetical protein